MIQRESPAGSGLEKVAVYCRLSEEDREKKHQEDESGSIQNQKTMLLQYAEQQGWQVYRVYSDDDYTGADRNRPAFQQLIQDAQQRRFDIVLCKTQSRFTRELELVEKYLHGLFPLWGIRFVSVVDNADTANKGNKKSRQIDLTRTFQMAGTANANGTFHGIFLLKESGFIFIKSCRAPLLGRARSLFIYDSVVDKTKRIV